MKEQVKKWMGSPPIKCDICKGTLGSVFYDCATKLGQWGILCHSCWKQHAIGIGTGRGQKYNTKTLVKLAG